MISDLTENEYEVLKAAIREAGRVLVPVVVTSDGEVIDGKGRVRAAEELKIKDYPREVVYGLDAEARRMRRLSLNCIRRHLSAEQKREIVRATLRATPDLSNNYLGELTGVDGKTVARVREELEVTSSVPKLTEFRGKDGKTRPRHVFARSARETAAASDALQQLGDKAPEKLLTAREVIRKAKRVEAAAERVSAQPTEVVPPDALVEIHHCDFRQMPVAPGSARLIFTDPLYHREHLPLFTDLAEWAMKVLEPGGVLMTYFGTSYLPEVVQRLGQRLNYVWQCQTVFSGEKTSIYDRQIRTGSKSLLLYSKGPYQPRNWMVDVVDSRKSKEHHEYGQPESEAEYYIRHLTNEQELVLDPFCGGATTGSVCKRLNRRCVTTDIDPKAIAIARERVRTTQVGRPVVSPAILTVPLAGDSSGWKVRMTAQMPAEDDDIEFELKSSLSLPA